MPLGASLLLLHGKTMSLLVWLHAWFTSWLQKLTALCSLKAVVFVAVKWVKLGKENCHFCPRVVLEFTKRSYKSFAY